MKTDDISFEKKNPYLAAKLLTIFTEHPIIFIGYSLTDENILKILNSIAQCLTSDNLQDGGAAPRQVHVDTARFLW